MKIIDWKNAITQRLGINSEIIYVFMFAIMFAVKMAGFYDGQLVFKVAFVLYVILFLAKLFLTEYSIKEYALVFLLLAVSALVYLNTGEKGLFLCFSMMVGMKGVSVNKVVKVGAIVGSLIMAFMIFTRVFGIFGEEYFTTYRYGVGTQIRHPLGYAHPNTLHISFFILTILIVYTATKQHFHVVLISLLCLLLNVYVFQYSGSRTGMLSSLFYIVLNTWNYRRNKCSVLEKIVYYAFYPITCIVAIVLPEVLSGKLFSIFDGYIFNLRFTIARYYMQNNKLSLWGIRLNNPDNFPYSLDMAGLYLFLQLGIVAFAVVGLISLWAVHSALKRQLFAEISVLMAIFFAGLWEPFLYNTAFKNLGFVLIGAMIFNGILSDDQEKKVLHNENAKRICVNIVIAVLVAILVSGAYLLFTKEYNAIYVDVEYTTIDDNNVLPAVYLTEAEEKNIIDNGGIVLRCGEPGAPVYQYSDALAKNEYRLRVLSVFTFAILLSGCLEYVYYRLKKYD